MSLAKNNNQTTHDTAGPLPVTLHPSEFPSNEFQFAISIQNIFNQLIFNISNDYDFLKETLKK